MTRTVLLTEHDLPTWSRRFAQGDAPSPLPYGVDALTSEGFALAGVSQSASRGGTKLRDVVEHRVGMGLERPLRAMPLVAGADLVLALLEGQGLLPGLLKRLGVPPYRSTPLVIMSVWLADDLRRSSQDHRRWIAQRVGAADLITHMSRSEADVLMDIGIPSEKLFSATFGVSHRFYSPGQGVRDIPLLAVGQDRGRDYRTLIDAIGGTELTLDLVSRPENLQGIDIPANVRAHPPVPLAQYRSLLKRAQIVAVPTHDLAYPTGQSVALEAAASGCAVVVTGTRAMREYFRDGIDAEFVEVGDVEGWRSTLQALREDPTRRDRLGSAARHNVVNKHNADHMWAEIADVLRDRGIVKGSRQTS